MLKDDDEIPEGYILGRGFGIPKDYIQTEEQLNKISQAMKNKIWIHNPELGINKRIDKDQEIPEGFILGRCKK